MASASLGPELDLPTLAMTLEGSQYDPEQFPGLVFHVKDPKAALLLFRSGKVVCTGSKSADEVRRAVEKTVKLIEKTGVAVNRKPEITVQNIVASADLGQNLNLNAIAMSLGLERVEYEPEQFPGLVYRMNDPKVVLLIFGSGKVVCTGGKRPQEIEAAVENITAELRAAGQLQ